MIEKLSKLNYHFMINIFVLFQLTIEYLQKKGFSLPLFIREKMGLYMSMPDSDFTISDVNIIHIYVK